MSNSSRSPRKPRVRHLLLVVVLVGTAEGQVIGATQTTVSPLTAASQVDVDCEACHGNRDFLSGKADTRELEGKLYVPLGLLADSRHAGLTCGQCHPTQVEGFPHRPGPAAEDCATCHTREGTAWDASIHAADASAGGDAADCIECHGDHDVLGADDPRSPTFPLNQAEQCAGCHSDPEIIGTYFSDPAAAQARTAVEQFQQTVHGLAASRAGLIVSATCSDCHGAHEILPADSIGSSVNRSRIAETCGSCHVGIREIYDRSAHGAAGAADESERRVAPPVCTDCHSAHDIVRADEPRWFIGVVEECAQCHEHLYETYLETYHGKVTQLGFALTAKCSDCHTAHDMRSALDPESSVFPTNLVATCGRCHPNAGANFVQYHAHGDAGDRQRYPSLYWPRAFMTLLLAGVFGFFGLHTLLWLNRLALDGLSRHRRPSVVSGSEEDPEEPVP